MSASSRVVVDTSALMAILLLEPDANAYKDCLSDATDAYLSAATLTELGIVCMARGSIGLRKMRLLLDEQNIEVLPHSCECADLSVDAYARFGKGRHPAALNFGDCCSYALAKSLDLPLLFKGDDFAQTDIRSALA